MKKIILILCSLLFAVQAFAQTPPYNEGQQRKRKLMSMLPVTSKDIIFLGNSITEGGNWTEFFDSKYVKNRGIGGDKVEWIFDRVDYLIAAKPRKLFLMIGINDINHGGSPEQVIADITRLVEMWQTGSPKTKLYVHSILPQNDIVRPSAAGKENDILTANAGIKKMCEEKGITYIDLHPVLGDRDGRLRADYTYDGLHLNPDGYFAWVDHIRNYVK